ncbi:MAG: hypothetical protein NTV97_26290 [Alphaproteobacteria bacterium]|nr:hypothetical protein [Alphaproteobacteria bacterium]
MSDESGQAYVDPTKLEAYARELALGCARLTDCMQAMKGDLATLGSTWRDAQYHEFQAKLAAVARQVDVFKAEAVRAQLQLELDAEAARRIHRSTLP